MTTSFATYASQFLNRQRNATGAASLSSSQPLFFSFTTDGDGSHRGGHGLANDDSDLDDIDDPHLRSSDGAPLASMSNTRRPGPEPSDEDDPYLRLDEDDSGSRYAAHSIPLMASSHARSDAEPSRGWLAHQPTQLRSLTPTPPSSDSEPSPGVSQPPRTLHSPPPLPPPPVSLSLTESLLPRDGHSRPLDLFSLPDPRHRTRRKYHDPVWTSVWLGSVSACVVGALVVLFLTREPPHPKRASFLYTTLLHTVPLLVILTTLSAVVSYAHIFLLRLFVKPVVIGTSVFVPVSLLISSIWAFVGSFMWDGDKQPTWGESWGLRLFSIIPLVLAVITGRRLLTLPQRVHATSSTLTLTTQLLSKHPLLLLLSPSVLLVAFIASIPFATLAFRLLLIGYATGPKSSTNWQWHVHGWADWAIVATLGVWYWSWAVARGVLRASTASVIAAWYYADPTAPPPAPMSTHTLHAAFHRATAPSLGSIVLAGLLLTLTQMLLLFTVFLRRVPTYLPIPLRLYTGPLLYAAGYLEDAAGSLSRYALVYVGITGEGFWVSARRARVLTSGVEGNGRNRKRFSSEPPLTLLTIAPLSLTLPFALSTYLFVAHTLGAPDQALEAAIMAGVVTALVGLFCVGLVKDTADTLYLCYCIDKDTGERRRAEVFEMFEYDSKGSERRRQQGRRQPPRQPPPPARRESVGAPGRPLPQQPISKRVEAMESPESSPELGGRDVGAETRMEAAPEFWDHGAQGASVVSRQEEEVDPFLAELQVEIDGPALGGYAVDGGSTGSLSDERAAGPSRSIGASSRREGRDLEEGLGSGLGSGLFPGSDIF
ncbi:hypothetical protein FA95DRAFT_1555150 [Auriscalpium vulgare]|uniref:Uncharacterized protein n=1 Tax=Auriscalpium vulgare TaxID=40419 RepID=A0ACB8S445_9AGAM|nr:hypothetical protein FA95DRAFT_1555150 [Auriscalpium vulgare]